MPLSVSENSFGLDSLTHLHNVTNYVHTPCPDFEMLKNRMFLPLTVNHKI